MEQMECRRVWLAVLKTVIYIVASCLLACIIYAGMNYFTLAGVERWQKADIIVEEEMQADLQENIGNRIAIIVGTASVWMAILTMMQQHITRNQDRALAFPKMILSKCEFCIGKELVEVNTSFYNSNEGKLLIKVNFKEAFAPCYVPFMYRVGVTKHSYGSTPTDHVKEKCVYLNILNVSSNFSGEGICMEAVIDEPGLIKEYCEKQFGAEDYKLDLILDVRWKNELLTWWIGIMSYMYLRYEIRLDNSQRCRTEENRYIFKVENINMKGAPLR